MRILVVEDYLPLREAIVTALREEGHSVDAAADGRSGDHQASSGGYDVLVLDLMLPEMGGLEVLRALRARGDKCHVLILTARDAVDDRVGGLDLGADDYLVKPFAMEELLARIRALLRRAYDQKAPVLRIGRLELHTADHTVKVAGDDVVLTAKEYALLEYLARREGEVVTRAEIWEHIYDERSKATSNVVDVYIGYLRKKLERPGESKLIHTRRGEGYILAERGG